MRKALVTFGDGPAAALLNMALPTFRDYADRHRYDLIVGDGTCDRPAPWMKVRLLQRALDTHDLALWIDADAIILDGSVDIATVVPPVAFQAFALHCGSPELGEAAPNTGVWVLRHGERARNFLAAVWAQEDLTEHAYWEQAAVMRLMGWTVDPPIVKTHKSEWEDGTHILSSEWNAIPMRPSGHVRIRHRAGWEWPLRTLDMGTDAAMVNGPRWRYWLGLLERLLRRRGVRVYDRSVRRVPQAVARRLRHDASSP